MLASFASKYFVCSKVGRFCSSIFWLFFLLPVGLLVAPLGGPSSGFDGPSDRALSVAVEQRAGCCGREKAMGSNPTKRLLGKEERHEGRKEGKWR